MLRAGLKPYPNIPEIEYRYGRDDTAYSWLMRLTDPNLKRREYPEVSYAAIRTATLGTMGISVDAPNHTVMTRFHLTPETAWATLRNIPVLDGEIALRHQGAKATTFTLQKGSAVTWRASFPVSLPSLRVDGVRTPARSAGSLNGHPETNVTVPVRPGESHTVEVAVGAALRDCVHANTRSREGLGERSPWPRAGVGCAQLFSNSAPFLASLIGKTADLNNKFALPARRT